MKYIAQQGFGSIIFFAIIALLSIFFDLFAWFFVLLLLLCIVFFRTRGEVEPANDLTAILTPVDGKILSIGVSKLDGERYTRVVIAKSTFGVGVLHAPFAGKSVKKRIRHGLFLCSHMNISDALNERVMLRFVNSDHKFAMRIIVGALSKGFEVDIAERFDAGDTIGFLPSGKVALYLPASVKICLSVGECVKSAEILGYFGEINA